MKIGVLTTTNSLVLPFILSEFKKISLKVDAIIVDGQISPDLMQAVKQRLEKDYEPPSIWELEITDTPTYFVKHHSSPETKELCQRLGIDVLVNGGTPRILKKDFLSHFKAIVNCHPGLLPNYRGCSCVEWAVFNGDPVGATAHLMSEKIDLGPALISEVMPVKAGDTYLAVRTRMLSHQSKVLAKGVSQLKDNDVNQLWQEHDPAEGTYYKTIDPEQLEQVISKMEAGKYSC